MAYREKINSMLRRFHSRVDPNGPMHPYDPTLGRCHVWTAHLDGDGYGRLGFHRRGGLIKAHRIAWMLAYNCDPGYWQVTHSCDNPACVNGSHLRLGDDADNMAQKMARGRGGYEKRDMSNLPRGAGHHNSKLTDEQAAEIRTRHAGHETIKSLAAAYGVHPNTISRIVKHRGWLHVT